MSENIAPAIILFEDNTQVRIVATAAVAAAATETPAVEKEQKELGELKSSSGDDNNVFHPSCTIFLFTGQGQHYRSMIMPLYRSSDIFNQQVQNCVNILIAALPELSEINNRISNVLCKLIGLKVDQLISYIYDNLPDHSSQIIQHLALFICEYSMTKVLMQNNIKPDILVGLSIGEWVSAVIAGIWTVQDALKLFCLRGSCIDQLIESTRDSPTSMVACDADQERVKTCLKEYDPCWFNHIDISLCNSPSRTVISGPVAKLQEFLQYLSDLKPLPFPSLQLPIPLALHSRVIKSIQEEFLLQAQSIEFHNNSCIFIPIFSNYLGCIELNNTKFLTSEYWFNQSCNTVQFVQVMNGLKENEFVKRSINRRNNGAINFIEVGPGCSLLNFIRQQTDSEPEFSKLSALGGVHYYQTYLSRDQRNSPQYNELLEIDTFNGFFTQFAKNNIQD